MNNRYLARFRLPGSRYTKSSPVILSAGALLEDTQSPRLVVQLKFKSISPRMLAGLTVTVRCFDAKDNEIERTGFTYGNLRVRRGQSFGKYTAIVLPMSGACRFTAAVTSAVFLDGGRWNRMEDGAAASTSAAPVAASPAWRMTAAEAAQPTFDAPAAAEALPSERPELPAKETRRSQKKGKWVALAAACVAVVLLGAIFLPKILGGDSVTPGGQTPTGGVATGDGNAATPNSTPQEGGASVPMKGEVPHVTTDTDYETVTYTYEQDGEGNCYITFEMMREVFPDANHFVFDGVPSIGDEIDRYIVDSFHMALLVCTRGEIGSDERYGTYSAVNDPNSTRCLLLFSDRYTLCGYAIAVPTDEGGGRWSLEITRCDYEFRQLYEQVCADFYSFQQPQFVPYNDIPGSGAAYFLNGYGMRLSEERFDNAQLFHMWGQYTSDYVNRHARDIVTLDRRYPREGRTMLYYLLDADYNLIGYSRLIHNSGGTDVVEVPNVTTPYDTETMDFFLEEDEDGRCVITWERLKEAFPQAQHYEVDFTTMISGDIDEHLTDSYCIAMLLAGERGGNLRRTGSFSSSISAATSIRILLFRDDNTLCGYSIMHPENLGGGRWRVEVTLCAYDISQLCSEQAQVFAGITPPDYIPFEQIGSSGAVYYLAGHSRNNMSAENASFKSAQMYHLSNKLHSRHLERHAQRLESISGGTRSGSGTTLLRYYMLLDANYRVIGYTYTLRTSAGAPQNVRLEQNNSGALQLVWDKPAWATEDTWVTVEARRTTDSDWTWANYVHAKTETTRTVSSLILHWSQPRQGDVYQFRVAFSGRDADGNFVDYTDYTLCSGTVTFHVLQAPFAATAQYGDTLTTYGNFLASREYFFIYTNADGNRGWTGFFTGHSGDSSFSSYDHPVDRLRSTGDLTGGSLYAWELYGATISGQNASVTVSARPEPVTIQ